MPNIEAIFNVTLYRQLIAAALRKISVGKTVQVTLVAVKVQEIQDAKLHHAVAAFLII